MRLERLNYNKIKIFLTIDDLMDRGLTKEDLWKDSLKVHQLFREMMDEASEELGFEASGPIAVEVYSLQAQGMVIIVTKNHEEEEIDEDYADDYIEMQVKLDQSYDIIFEFNEFEDIIQLSNALFSQGIKEGAVYSHQNRFYFMLDEHQPIEVDSLVSIIAEYGNPSMISIHYLHEYGKCLLPDSAIEKLHHYYWSNTK
ncbi:MULTISPECIES: genetic competence negative regulator [Metabacillus]|jgi:adapter protein MecA 1/2|uniref:Genetic competence negative regulator n=1 Tax=Metabacillus hrfriensis TaxID=3048891 RepID=A0ACD4R882_9BACI|nr:MULTISPECIES: genetic competence negative regulator [Metabacillus]UAL50844.1 genetic competence negative regulator [Metabacillus dongyingensis]UOK56884.1 genetic competence negative regulator [Bacillus sp. OVS6]USK27120.1 genetic competence negative regulator [Bacillus sp. CMF21]WHZ56342.1 genetic competence negative regulator [Metabacillus sp. CT-WN-B3]